CDGAPRNRLDIRLAALFHDLGKPRTHALDENGLPTFYHHEEVSEGLARAIMKRLRFSNALETKVTHLVRHHMFHYEENWSDAAVRRFLARVGKDEIQDLFLLRRADTYGTAGKSVQDASLAAFSEHIHRVLDAESALTLKDLAIDGNTLAREAGIPRGPIMGTVLNELLASVIDDPSLNSQERLVQIARNFHENHLKRLEGS
ncbi:MAG TPA: HD domain-containing protein, partial [Spirochaetia bacterium]|nr:HD domain-containing protein [Spirochaetia bacterium]